ECIPAHCRASSGMEFSNACGKRDFLSLGEWNTLPIIIQHIFHFNCHRRDAQNFVTAVDNVAFGRNKHVIPLRQEDSLRLTGLIGETKKLQRNRWRRWRSLRNRRRGILSMVSCAIFFRLRDFHHVTEDVPPCPFVFGIFASPQPVIAQRRIEGTTGSIRLSGGFDNSPSRLSRPCDRRYCWRR